MNHTYLIVEPSIEPHIALIRLNRPKELNALNLELMAELRDTLKQLDQDDEVRAIVITGDERAFAAGADIRQMSGKSAVDMLLIDQFSTWDTIKKIKKPLIAAVSGFALGGGNELVMHCDLVVASETAQFGQPEIKLGVIPGAGGTPHRHGNAQAAALNLQDLRQQQHAVLHHVERDDQHGSWQAPQTQQRLPDVRLLYHCGQTDSVEAPVRRLPDTKKRPHDEASNLP